MFLAHLTHEAVQKIGGIGAVLEGLVTARHYRSNVKRTVLAGPLPVEDRKVIESGRADLNIQHASRMEDRTAAIGMGQIERRYGVEIFYGIRKYAGGDAGIDNEAEVLLIDVSKMPREQVRATKNWFQEEYGLRFDKFRLPEIQDRFVRLTLPMYEALLTLRRSKDGPCVVVSHEWFGLPLAYWVIGRRDPRFRTVFHAHEVAPVRPIIEKHPAHDVMFYNVMRAASEQSKSLPDIFGPQEAALPAALVMRSHRVNRILAVSKPVADELRFLGPAFQKRPIDLVYNGIGATKISVEVKNEAHKRLEEYARRLLGWRPDYVFTHVARPVISKAFWRDLQVMAELDPKLVAAGQRAVHFLLASATLPRQPAEVAKMEKDHDWPLQHQKGYPDLVGPEVAVDRAVKAFNRKAKASCAVFINQFGWNRALCGSRMPTAMLETDIRRGSDVEFGLSAYEPFGIAQIEPLPFGTLCAISAACGCRGFVEQVDVKHELPTLHAKEYALPQRNMSLNKLTKMAAREAAEVEKDVAAQLADELFAALPRSDKDRKRYLMLGYRYARQMSWDVVVRDMFLPAIKECLG